MAHAIANTPYIQREPQLVDSTKCGILAAHLSPTKLREVVERLGYVGMLWIQGSLSYGQGPRLQRARLLIVALRESTVGGVRHCHTPTMRSDSPNQTGYHVEQNCVGRVVLILASVGTRTILESTRTRGQLSYDWIVHRLASVRLLILYPGTPLSDTFILYARPRRHPPSYRYPREPARLVPTSRPDTRGSSGLLSYPPVRTGRPPDYP